MLSTLRFAFYWPLIGLCKVSLPQTAPAGAANNRLSCSEAMSEPVPVVNEVNESHFITCFSGPQSGGDTLPCIAIVDSPPEDVFIGAPSNAPSENKDLEEAGEQTSECATSPNQPSCSLAAPIESFLSEISISSDVYEERDCPPFAVDSTIGLRPRMEDTTAVAPLQVKTAAGAEARLHFFACYDGHGGSQASSHCSSRLHLHLQAALDGINSEDQEGSNKSSSLDQSVISALMQAYEMTDVEFAKDPICESVGSTAVVAIVSESLIWIANLGDSRATLSSAGVAIQLSQDQKPDRSVTDALRSTVSTFSSHTNDHP